MRVLNVNMTLDPLGGGGTAERTLQISRALTGKGYPNRILTTDRGLSQDYMQYCKKAWDLNICALPSLWPRFYLPKPSQSIIRGLVADSDIIHLMCHWTLLNAMVYREVRRQRKSFVVCPAGTLPIYGRSKIVKNLYNVLVGREIILRANGHIAIAPNELQHFECYGVRPERVCLIPNGINPDDFPKGGENNFRDRFGVGNAPLILFLGRLNRIKGPDLLLDAFCRCCENGHLREHHLALAGPDEGLLQQLEKTADAKSVRNRVHFVGHITRAEKAEAFNAADLLVIPSRQEAMSIVVLEAGITGTPVLITDQCGFNDVAEVGGGVVVPASVDGLYSGLLAITEDPARLKCMGSKLKDYTQTHFLWDSIVDRHLELFLRVIG